MQEPRNDWQRLLRRWANSQVSQEMRRYFFRCFLELQSDPQSVQVGHFQFFVAAGVDAREGLKVYFDI